MPLCCISRIVPPGDPKIINTDLNETHVSFVAYAYVKKDLFGSLDVPLRKMFSTFDITNRQFYSHSSRSLKMADDATVKFVRSTEIATTFPRFKCVTLLRLGQT